MNECELWFERIEEEEEEERDRFGPIINVRSKEVKLRNMHFLFQKLMND